MNPMHVLKLFILASLAGTMLVGVLFMMRTGDEDEMRSHAKRVVYDAKVEKLEKEQNNEVDSIKKNNELPMTSKIATTVDSGSNVQQSSHLASVHIFYYPWYGNPEFDNGRYYHWNHPVLKPSPTSKLRPRAHNPPNDLASIFYPALGAYSSRNPAVIDRHFKSISAAGVDVVSVSWYPAGKADEQGHPWDSLIPALLNAAEKYKLKVTFHLEPYEERTAASVRDDIEYVIKNYGTHPAFYRTVFAKKKTENPLPLFYIYDSYKIPNDEWTTISTVNGSASIRNTEIDSLLIGLILKLNEVDSFHSSGFDGVYTYFAADGFTEASSMNNWSTLSKMCAERDLLFVPSIGPGYDDSPVRPWNRVNTRSRENGSYYKEHFEAAHSAKPDLISITSFNEWHEGTQIEPAVKFTSDNESANVYQFYSNGPEEYLQLTHDMIQMYFVPHHANIPKNIAQISTEVGGRFRVIWLVQDDSQLDHNFTSTANTCPDVDFLRDVLKEHEQKGRRFILPFADSDAINHILKPMQYLVQEGVLIEYLRDALINSPELLQTFAINGQRCMEILNLMVDACSFTFESALRLFSENSKELLQVGRKGISDRIEVFTGRGIVTGSQLGRIVRQCPAILYASTPAKIEMGLENISSFFSQKDIVRLMKNVPHLVLKPFEEMEQKYEYVYFHMGIEPNELSYAINWVDMTLDELMMRHKFLLKTGKYDNPPCYRITDTDDQTFAIQVAEVSPEEWTVFRALYDKQAALEDKDQPYEKVKPSLRKAFERRLKKAAEVEDHEL
ncbi:Glycoprotein endo-alpha-1,2-mannosidase [Aphelenchoides besseyi]|nr:Glycoprotein endo-alpha-1,2-mannosidase [Aphelenchoides besseyi]KAI6208234.1 Glycoprotein endo-alpha-1,2-mannosidase [Aphelenchoides besseyi]